MKKLSEILPGVLEANPMLQEGMTLGILNFSAVAEFIRPLVAARCKKKVSKAAIQMGLSRMRSETVRGRRKAAVFKVSSINVRSSLSSLTYTCSSEIDRSLSRIYQFAERQRLFLIVSHGTNEITFLCDSALVARIRKELGVGVKNVQGALAGLSIRFDEKYVERPGLLYFLIQQITMQNINIYEISSTFTELVIYVKEADISLAFDTVYRQFAKSKAPQ